MRRSGVRSPSAPPTIWQPPVVIACTAGDLASPMLVRKRHPKPADLGLSAEEGRVLRALTTPRRVQEFVVGLHANFEEAGDTLRSVRVVLRHRRAHCIEA